MLKKEILVMALILVISSAYGFQAQIGSQEDAATPETPQNIEVTIENTAEEPRTYRPDLVNNRYNFLYIPSTSKTIAPGEQGTFTLSASPGNDVLNGNYRYNLKIEETETGNSQTLTEYVRVSRENDLQLVYTSTSQESYNPGQEVTLETEIKNYGTSSRQNYNVTAEAFNQTNIETGLDINREAERRYTHTFQTTNQTKPGEHKITIKLQKEDQTTKIGTRTAQINEKPIIQEETTTSNHIIRSTETKTIKNTGNAETNHTIQTDLNPFLAPITNFNHDPVQTENNGNQETIYQHQFQIQPDEEKQLEKTVQYWIPASALILLVGMITTISKLREEISFNKTTNPQNGNIKVQLEIKNNSGKKLEDLQIKDYIPNIAKVKEDFPMAKPKIRKKKEGTELTWNIDELEPQSQRIIEYTISPVVEVEEGATLQPAKLKRGEETIKETDEIETEFKPK